MKYYDELKHSGLTKSESKVYLALLRKGSSKAGTIAKESELDRTSTYNCLKSLLHKGLVSYVVIGKIKYFQALNPNNLEIYIKDKLDTIKQILPELQQLYKSTKLQENVRLFKGNKGVKYILDDIVKEGKDNCIFGSEGQLKERQPYYAKRFLAQLQEKKISVRSIIRKSRKKYNTKLQEYRYISMATESPVVTNIYGNKISIIIWSEIPEIIMIDNKTAADAYREYFEFMWKSAKK